MAEEEHCSAEKRLKENTDRAQVREKSEKTGCWEHYIEVKRLKGDTDEVEVNEVREKTGWELLLHQSLNFHDCFTWSDFISGLLLCFAPTALDIGTDFNLARHYSTPFCDSTTKS